MLTFVRTYSYFEPTFTYNVYVNDGVLGATNIGAVARNPQSRKWYASNRTWFGGDDLPGTFRTRRDAAAALLHAADAAEKVGA